MNYILAYYIIVMAWIRYEMRYAINLQKEEEMVRKSNRGV